MASFDQLWRLAGFGDRGVAVNRPEEYMMRVFVAGATGVLGHRCVARMATRGFEVAGVSRSARKRVELASLGATPIDLDLFDQDAVVAAVTGHDVVYNLATAIPVGHQVNELSAWHDNHRIRRDVSRNLVDAALVTGASRYVQESIALLYADGGDGFLDEFAPVDATEITSSALDAETEAARFAAEGGTGIALRFGQFYGFDSKHTVAALQAARAGRPVELGTESAYRSSVTTDDAASAVVAALGAPSGTYNVVDDQPLRRSNYVDALAHALRVPSPTAKSVEAPLPPEFSMMLRSQRVSNHRFKEASGWQPRFSNACDG